MAVESSKFARRRGPAGRSASYLLCAVLLLASTAAAAQPTSGIVPGTDVVIYDDEYIDLGRPPEWQMFGDELAKLRSLHDGCSRDYAERRNQMLKGLTSEAEAAEAKVPKLLAAGKSSQAVEALRFAIENRRLIGWLPPAKLPEPCPPETPPSFTIVGTGIMLYDFELAAKWSQKLDALRERQVTCSGYSNLLQTTKDELAADVAAREKALGGALPPATRASLESDRDALEQIGDTFHSPCIAPRRATPRASVKAKPSPKPKAAVKQHDSGTSSAVQIGVGMGLGILLNRGNRSNQNQQPKNW